MGTKPKCSTEGCERDAYSKGLCSGCYGRRWREARRTGGLQLTGGAIEDETVKPDAITVVSPTHLVATNPTEMAEARVGAKEWLTAKLAEIETNIIECNRAINVAKENGWATGALTASRNRAVDDETFYNKVLAALEAGFTIIPDFPLEIFAVRRGEPEAQGQQEYNGAVNAGNTWMGRPAQPDYAPAGAGEYRNPQPYTSTSIRENRAPNAQERNEPRYFTTVYRSGYPVGPIVFPSTTARSPVMQATSNAMAEKVFDQVGVCLPVVQQGSRRQVQQGARAGDPLVIGQVVRKRVGSQQKVISFIIAWYLNLNEL